MASLSRIGWLSALSVSLAGCGDEPQENQPPPVSAPARPLRDDPSPPTARWRQVRELEADVAAVRSPSDGGGSARIELAPGEVAEVRAGALGHWTVIYTTGPLGVAVGGSLKFMPEPFWGWSVPQTFRPEAVGYTEVSCAAPGVELEAFTVGDLRNGYLMISVLGRALAEGDEVRIEYGAGEVGAVADRHAERDAHLWLYVDGDGDGVLGLLEDSPTLDVLAGPPTRLVVTGPSVVRPGEEFALTVAVLDQLGNLTPGVTGTVHLKNRPRDWSLPESFRLESTDHGRRTLQLKAETAGVLRLRARMEVDGITLEGEANPLWIDERAPRVYWGDLHGHSNYTDGTGLPEDWYTYARDVAALDVAALTDHDHYGVRFLDSHGELWEDIRQQVEDFHEPGRFVTLLAYEWTSWIHGHRHVLYFEEGGEILSSLDPRYRTPAQLWDALRGKQALTFAHHSAGDPVPTNWSYRPDPILEPVTEIMSVHGSSEAADSPRVLRRPVPGNFVRDLLDDGVRLGFVGSGDGHDGHPGLAHLSPVYGWIGDPRGVRPPRMGTGGLAGILASDLTRSGVLEALRARRVYATSGPRILVQATLAGHPMGSLIAVSELPDEPTLRVLVLGTAGLRRVDLVQPGRVESLTLSGELKFVAELPLGELVPGAYVYIRVLQQDDALAWSSPIFFE